MGVPSFFRWLAEKYACVVINCEEEFPVVIEGVEIPIDISKPNPNKTEFDNLYLDLNGIIHNCSHPEDKDAPPTEEEMIAAMFKYIDRVVAAARPRRLLYLAIDGPAPKAKMNQQRKRRFKSARDAKKANEIEAELRADSEKKGIELPPEKVVWDSNVITPGTPFMDKVAKALRYYIHNRLNYSAGWKNLKVIFSDSGSPGEGEHKIVEYIRLQRLQKGYDPNMKHVIHGLDADLIMLALATHEPHFYILREFVTVSGKVNKEQLKESGDYLHKPLQFLQVGVLREHLEKELKVDNLPFKWDLERAIDDFIFLCFFVGNDFLPHLPSLDIREGALDLLIKLYRTNLPSMKGYLTTNGDLNMENVEILMRQLGSIEEDIFKSRAQKERAMKARKRRRDESEAYNRTNPEEMYKLGDNRSNINDSFQKVSNVQDEKTVNEQNKQALKRLREEFDLDQEEPQPEGEETEVHETTEVNAEGIAVPAFKRRRLKKEENEQPIITKIPEKTAEQKKKEITTFLSELKEKVNKRQEVDEEKFPDLVKLGETGSKERYYLEKFKFEYSPQSPQLRHVVLKYIEGLAWVMKYYYQGCPSWGWYYPYHYAPFSVDLTDLSSLKIKFELGKPLKPFDQLMTVLPPASAHALPTEYQKLMKDPSSVLIEYYPDEDSLEIDLNGKRAEWLGVVLLPFMDTELLMKETAKLEYSLTEEEKRRNNFTDNVLVVHDDHEIAPILMSVYIHEGRKGTLDGSGGIAGYVTAYKDHIAPSSKYVSPIDSQDFITENRVVSACYHLPKFQPHKPVLLEGVKLPESQLAKMEVPQTSYTDSFTRFITPYLLRQDHNETSQMQQYYKKPLESERPYHQRHDGSRGYNNNYNNNNYQRRDNGGHRGGEQYQDRGGYSRNEGGSGSSYNRDSGRYGQHQNQHSSSSSSGSSYNRTNYGDDRRNERRDDRRDFRRDDRREERRDDHRREERRDYSNNRDKGHDYNSNRSSSGYRRDGYERHDRQASSSSGRGYDRQSSSRDDSYVINTSGSYYNKPPSSSSAASSSSPDYYSRQRSHHSQRPSQYDSHQHQQVQQQQHQQHQPQHYAQAQMQQAAVAPQAYAYQQPDAQAGYQQPQEQATATTTSTTATAYSADPYAAYYAQQNPYAAAYQQNAYYYPQQQQQQQQYYVYPQATQASGAVDASAQQAVQTQQQQAAVPQQQQYPAEYQYVPDPNYTYPPQQQ